MFSLPPGSVAVVDTVSARQFVDLLGTLGQPDLVVNLDARTDVSSGTTQFHAKRYFEAREHLVALEPDELHCRIAAQGLSTPEMIQLLITFGLPLHGVRTETPGFTVFIDFAEMGVGRKIWFKYSPDRTEAGAVEAFRCEHFQNDTEWNTYGALRTVVPGWYQHPCGRPGVDTFHVHFSD